LRRRRFDADSQIAQIIELKLNAKKLKMDLLTSDTEWIASESQIHYPENNFLFGSETYQLIGVAMEVHRYLGYGFNEVVYKDALEEEFNRRNISYEREKKYMVEYKGVILPHYYIADFVIDSKIILEVKAQVGVHEDAVSQVINYLAASKLKVGLIVNFGEGSLKYKRVAFSRDKPGE
jgi:GxxExxY protein